MQGMRREGVADTGGSAVQGGMVAHQEGGEQQDWGVLDKAPAHGLEVPPLVTDEEIEGLVAAYYILERRQNLRTRNAWASVIDRPAFGVHGNSFRQSCSSSGSTC